MSAHYHFNCRYSRADREVKFRYAIQQVQRVFSTQNSAATYNRVYIIHIDNTPQLHHPFQPININHTATPLTTTKFEATPNRRG